MNNAELLLAVVGMWAMWFMGFAAGRMTKR